MIKTGL